MHLRLSHGLLLVVLLLVVSNETGLSDQSQSRPTQRSLRTVLDEHKAGIASRDQGLQLKPWMYWRGFYDSLRYFEKNAGPDLAARSVGRSAGIRPESVEPLSRLGAAFVEQLVSIETRAQATLLQRHGSGPPVGVNGERFMLVQKGLSPYDLAKRAGLIESVEAQSNALLATHLAAVKAAVSPDDFSALSRFVNTTMASRTITFAEGTPGGPRPAHPLALDLSARSLKR
jgi:hypothetical protein